MSRTGVLSLLIALLLPAQPAAGPQVLVFPSEIDRSDQPYALYVPKNFDPGRTYPLVISLHAEDSNHRTELRHVFGIPNLPGETDAEAARSFPRFPDADYLVAAPLARGTMGYQGIAERDVYDVVRDVKRRFAVDEERIYLTGSSMGGGGVLWLALTNPGMWAAVAAVCPLAPPGTEQLAGNAHNLPVHLFQGGLDPLVKPQSTRDWHRRFLDAGVRAAYVEYPRVRHNAWDQAYKDGSIFSWFARHKRTQAPDRVVYTTTQYAHDSAYWVDLTRITPGQPASIDARFTGQNELSVTTSGVDAIRLDLRGHPRLTRGRPLTVQLDGPALRARGSGGAFSFTRAGGAWRIGPYARGSSEKNAGFEGPLRSVLSRRHVYVFGTSNASDEELALRRKVAETAAEWSEARSRLLLTLRALPDDEAERESSPAGLVLFGNTRTNRLLGRWNSILPMELNPGAADYGLLYVYPVGGARLGLIASGLPWWTSVTPAPREPAFIPARIRGLWNLPDFVLFRGSLEHIVVQGYFDRQWRLRAADAAALERTGAVVVNRDMRRLEL